MTRYLLLFSMLVVGLCACKDDPDDSPAQQATMSLNVIEAMPLQVVTASVQGFEVGPVEYDGQVGGVSTVFVRSSEFALSTLPARARVRGRREVLSLRLRRTIG